MVRHHLEEFWASVYLGERRAGGAAPVDLSPVLVFGYLLMRLFR